VVLVVSTNARKEQRHFLEHFANRSAARRTEGRGPVFDHVLLQALDAELHVNPREFGSVASGASAYEAQRQGAERQAMRDWWLLHASDVLVGGMTGAFTSGFSASAGLVSRKEQAVYAMDFEWGPKRGRGCPTGGGTAKRLISKAGPRSFMCAGRFCS